MNNRVSVEWKLSSCLYREQKLPTVPETLLKRRKKVDEVRKARALAKKASKTVSFMTQWWSVGTT